MTTNQTEHKIGNYGATALLTTDTTTDGASVNLFWQDSTKREVKQAFHLLMSETRALYDLLREHYGDATD